MEKKCAYQIIVRNGDGEEIHERAAPINNLVLAMATIYTFPSEKKKDPFSLALSDFPNTRAGFNANSNGIWDMNSLKICTDKRETGERFADYLHIAG